MKRILVIGAGGQIGTELVPHLQKLYGKDNVIGADLKDALVEKLRENGIGEKVDATDAQAVADLVKKYKADAIFNLVALLSATGEKNPQLAWNINMGALLNSLNVAKEFGCAVFTPSSIGAFGTSTPHDMTPQD
ncbi:MAG: NAD-dependent epimerase/dehydratase family protein, partial [Bacteroidales bacterium]|nr:NAD-dependent epimerase/dehydratase family protein [Bacteroidales bacterium]